MYLNRKYFYTAYPPMLSHVEPLSRALRLGLGGMGRQAATTDQPGQPISRNLREPLIAITSFSSWVSQQKVVSKIFD